MIRKLYYVLTMPYILAHDLGTTGNKTNLFDETGALVASHLETYDVSYPQAGWAEQDPDDWWRAVCASSRALLAQAKVHTVDVAAVTFSGQMMGVVAMAHHPSATSQAVCRCAASCTMPSRARKFL